MTLDEFMRKIPSEHRRNMGRVVSEIKTRNTLNNILEWFEDPEAEQVKLLGSSVTTQDKKRFLDANKKLKPIFIPKDVSFIKILQKALGTSGRSRLDLLDDAELKYAKDYIMGRLNMKDQKPEAVCERITSLQRMLMLAYGYGDERLSETLVTIVMDLAYAASVIESIIEK